MHSPTGSLFHSRLGRAIGVAATMSVASTAWSQDWLDTAAGNSLKEDDRLFSVVEIDGEDAIRTTSTATNIHSHFRTPFQTTSFRGEFRVDNSRGGVGITFHSDYPNSDTYYRLRRFKRKDFHISNHGTSTSGDGSSGVVPRAKVWYAFAVSVENGSSETRIRAKIWEAKGSEPDSWQIDVRDDSETRLVSGKVGLWSMGSGRKYWRRLQVNGRPLGESIVEPNLEPSVRIVEVLEQGSVGSETTLAFRGEASDPDSSLGSGDCVWDFGDGESLKGAEVEHSFTSPGDYEVTVRVDDGAGGVASDRVTVTIEEPVVPEEAPTLGAHGWIDTRAKNSLSVDDRLFTVDEIDSASVLRTQSNGTNIHSHYALPNNGVAAGLFSGRMMGNHSDAGFGVTFLSDYPNADRYYRLRSHGDDEFHISPHGTSIEGDGGSGLQPVPNAWYRFLIEFAALPDRTRIRAKVWPDGTPEPNDWQIDCNDTSSTRLKSGTVGCWSMGAGAKAWCDLALDRRAIPLIRADNPVSGDLVKTIDFESNVSGLDGLLLERANDRARSGSASLGINFGTEVRTSTALPGPFLDDLLPFVGLPTVHARLWVSFDEDFALDVAAMNEALDTYLSARPDALAASAQESVRSILSALAGAAIPTLRANEWNCIGLRYSNDGEVGELALLVGGVEVANAEALDHSTILAVLDLFAHLTRYNGSRTSATRAWVDDIVLSTAGVGCN